MILTSIWPLKVQGNKGGCIASNSKGDNVFHLMVGVGISVITKSIGAMHNTNPSAYEMNKAFITKQ